MKNPNCIDTMLVPNPPATLGLPPFGKSVLRMITGWIERSRQRRQLSMLNDAALKDIGLTRTDVRIEIEKPFWIL